MNQASMCPDDPRITSEQDFRVAWQLFRSMHDAPTLAAATSLIGWLRENPRHVRAFDEALTLWALTGAATLDRLVAGRGPERDQVQ